MDKIALNVIALTNSESHPGNYALILEEQSGTRRIPIVIGGFEAQAIAVTLENMKPQRPLTHDLFKHTLDVLGSRLQEVIITAYVDKVFRAQMMVIDVTETVHTVDARSSDAIALAVRFVCPIYTYESVLETVSFSGEPAGGDSQKKGPFSSYSVNELEALLEKVLAKEDYKSAARIRDALGKIKKQR